MDRILETALFFRPSCQGMRSLMNDLARFCNPGTPFGVPLISLLSFIGWSLHVFDFGHLRFLGPVCVCVLQTVSCGLGDARNHLRWC